MLGECRKAKEDVMKPLAYVDGCSFVTPAAAVSAQDMAAQALVENGAQPRHFQCGRRGDRH